MISKPEGLSTLGQVVLLLKYFVLDETKRPSLQSISQERKNRFKTPILKTEYKRQNLWEWVSESQQQSASLLSKQIYY